MLIFWQSFQRNFEKKKKLQALGVVVMVGIPGY